MVRVKPAIAARPGLDVVVADALREQVLRGELKPGAHVVEADVARRFEVSHGTVRAALRHLQAEGLVEFRPRRGMFITTFTAEDVLELCSLRDSLEALAAELAAERADATGQQALRKVLSDMARAVGSGDRAACMELDLKFHTTIIGLSGHRRLQQTYGQLVSQVRLFMAMTEPLHIHLDEILAIHQPIADAIFAGRSREAARLSATHNRPDGDRLASMLRDDL